MFIEIYSLRGAHFLNEMNGVPRLTTHVALSFSSELSAATSEPNARRVQGSERAQERH
jgi:hypothetical protein